MAEKQKETVAAEKSGNELVKALLPATIVWLKAILYFLVLPYKIWTSTTIRLASLSGNAFVSNDEEFPMYTFTKIAYDATIFIFGILTVLVGVIGLLTAGAEGLFAGLVFYIIIPVVSLFKEIITMSLGVIKRLEAIDKNTQK